MNKNDKFDVNVELIGHYLGKAQRVLDKTLFELADGTGIKSKSMATLMMAYGSATSAKNILAASNAILAKQSEETMENIWEDYKNLTVVLQAASQLAEDIAEKLGFDDAISFRDVRAEGLDQQEFSELIREFRDFEKFYVSSSNEEALN